MKNKIKYLIIIFALTFLSFILFNTTSFAGYQDLKNLNYDVQLNKDGTVNVIETWDILVSDTNTLFTNFEIDYNKYGAITNVSVSEITAGGDIINFKNTYEYAYHVEKNGFYALQTDSDKFEIAWGVSIKNAEERTYRISYTIENGIKTYNDCSEFYWQFIGEENEISADKVTGTIKLPQAVQNIENLKVWAHGPLYGEIKIIDNETVKFEVSHLPSKTMVETRIAVLENIFTQNTNTQNKNKIDEILSEEIEWANEANRTREREKNKEKNIIFVITIFVIVVISIVIAGLGFFIVKIIKYIQEILKIKKRKPEEHIEYFREIPDEEATPAEAAYLYYFDQKNKFKNNLSKIVSATILDLALKKIISFEEKGNEIEIKLNENADISKLKYDESTIYSILTEANDYKNKNKENTDITVTMKDIEKYAKKHDKQFLSKIEGIEKTVKGFNNLKGYYDEKSNRKSEDWRETKGNYFAVGFCFALAVIPMIFAPFCLICGILCSILEKKTRRLTKKGINEQEKWKGLKRYMENFSLLDEREVPELALWEKYLVYATAFGIADKVLEQLKIKYPEIMDENYFANNTYSYIYMMNRINFDRAITAGVNRAYSAGLMERAAREASSSGSFSSGGGRRWRLFFWRPVAGGRRTVGMGGR